MQPDPVVVARHLADEVLFPGALAVDAAPLVPVERLDALAAAGLYGLVGPTSAGGFGADARTARTVTELITSGDLTVSFVWQQHHSAVRGVAGATALHDRFLEPLCRGTIRAGVAFTHLRRPGPPMLVATPEGSGWRLGGTAPWLTGWDRIDVVHVAALTPDGEVLWVLLDAVAGPSLAVEPVPLSALAASGTVVAHLDGLPVAPERVTARVPFDRWSAQDRRGLAANGANALGVTLRATALLGPSRFDDELAATRAALDAADEGDPASLPAVRGRCCALAVRATAALVASGGGRAVQLDHHAQRLAREAAFCLVQGQNAEIRRATLQALGASSSERS